MIHHFPFGMGLGHLKKDYIEFKRVGIFDGKAVEVTLREPYSRDLLQVVKSIKQRQKLIAYRYKEGKLLFVKKEASECPLNNRNEWQFNMLSVVFYLTVKSLLKILEWSRRQALAQDSAYKVGVQKLEELLQSPYSIDTINLKKRFLRQTN